MPSDREVCSEDKGAAGDGKQSLGLVAIVVRDYD